MKPFTALTYRSYTSTKIGAFLLALLFLFSSVVAYHREVEAAPALVAPVQSLSLPIEIGTVVDRFLSPKNNAPTVICIQDAHLIYDAQKNVQGILDRIQSTDNVPVCVEGAEGAVDVSYFRAFPLREEKEALVDALLHEGTLSGPEAYAITAPQNVILRGVDNEEDYVKNIETYRAVMNMRKSVESYLARVQTVMKPLEKKLLSPECRTFLMQQGLFEADNGAESAQLNYLRYLISEAKRLNIPMGRYRYFSELMALWRFQKNIKTAYMSHEINELVEDRLLPVMSEDDALRLAHAEIDMKNEGPAVVGYYSLLRELSLSYGVDFREYTNLNLFLNYLLLADRVDAVKLLKERVCIEKQILNKLAVDTNQKRLIQYRTHIAVLKKVFALKAVPDDVRYLRQHKKQLTTAAFASFLTEQGVVLRPGMRLSDDFLLENYLPVVERFYALAEKREDAFIANTLRELRRNNATSVALVLGGYHTRGVQERLRTKGINYITISPRIGEVPADSLYEKVMTSYDMYTGVRDGERGGTVKELSSIAVLSKTGVNAEPVNRLINRFFEMGIDAIESGAQEFLRVRLSERDDVFDPETNPRYYYEKYLKEKFDAWNKDSNAITLLYDKEKNEAIFVTLEGIRQVASSHSLRELETVLPQIVTARKITELRLAENIKEERTIGELVAHMAEDNPAHIRELAARTIIEEVTAPEHEELRLDALEVLLPLIIPHMDTSRPSEGEVDLHSHTFRSDAYPTPTARALHAFEIGLRAFAVVDHGLFSHPDDEVFDALARINNAITQRTPDLPLLQCVPVAAEVNVNYKGEEFHALSYVATLNDSQRSVLESFEKEVLVPFRELGYLRGEQVREKLNAFFAEKGHSDIFLTPEDVDEVLRDSYYPSAVGDALWHKYEGTENENILREFGINGGKQVWYSIVRPQKMDLFSEFFEKMPTFEDYVQCIDNTGGKIAIAHPDEVIDAKEGLLEDILETLAQMCLEGKLSPNAILGVSWYSHKVQRSGYADKIKRYIEYLNTYHPFYKHYNLLLLPESDCHGKFSMPKNPMGRFDVRGYYPDDKEAYAQEILSAINKKNEPLPDEFCRQIEKDYHRCDALLKTAIGDDEDVIVAKNNMMNVKSRAKKIHENFDDTLKSDLDYSFYIVEIKKLFTTITEAANREELHRQLRDALLQYWTQPQNVRRLNSAILDLFHEVELFHSEEVLSDFIKMIDMIQTGGSFYRRFINRCGLFIGKVAAVIALLISAVVFFPLMIMIRVVAKQRVFFTQERLGFRGKPFTIYKIQTLINGDHKRIPRWGAFLRSWGLDELPQLLNIIKGDMVWCAPRPLMPKDVSDMFKHTILYVSPPGYVEIDVLTRRGAGSSLYGHSGDHDAAFKQWCSAMHDVVHFGSGSYEVKLCFYFFRQLARRVIRTINKWFLLLKWKMTCSRDTRRVLRHALLEEIACIALEKTTLSHYEKKHIQLLDKRYRSFINKIELCMVLLCENPTMSIPDIARLFKVSFYEALVMVQVLACADRVRSYVESETHDMTIAAFSNEDIADKTSFPDIAIAVDIDQIQKSMRGEGNVNTKYTITIISQLKYSSGDRLNSGLLRKEAISLPHVGSGILISELKKDPRVGSVNLCAFSDSQMFTYAANSDLVLISVKILNAHVAFDLVKKLNALEQPPKIVLGGSYISLEPENAVRYASICVGDGEGLMSTILDDVDRDHLRLRYQRETPCAFSKDGYVTPDWKTYYDELKKRRKENFTWSVLGIKKYTLKAICEYIFSGIEFSRGCPLSCFFCGVSIHQPKVTLRKDMASIENELKENKPGFLLYVADSNAAISREHLLKVVRLLKRKKIRYSFQAPLATFIEDEQLYGGELLREMSGYCMYVFVGIEDISQDSIPGDRGKKGAAVIKKGIAILHCYDIGVVGSLVFGIDGQTTEVFAKNLRILEQTQVDFVLPQVATPVPGTKNYHQLQEAKRIYVSNYKWYNHRYLVFFHNEMRLAEFFKGYIAFSKNFYSLRSIWKRLVHGRRWLRMKDLKTRPSEIIAIVLMRLLFIIGNLLTTKGKDYEEDVRSRLADTDILMHLPPTMTPDQLQQIKELLRMFDVDENRYRIDSAEGNLREKDHSGHSKSLMPEGTIERFLQEKLLPLEGDNLAFGPFDFEGEGTRVPELTTPVLEALFACARFHHSGQKRDDVFMDALAEDRLEGTDYMAHVLGVVSILVNRFGVTDPYVIAAAFLHDVFEDSILYYVENPADVKNLTELEMWQLRMRGASHKEITPAQRKKVEEKVCDELHAAGLQDHEIERILAYVRAMTHDESKDVMKDYFPGLINEGPDAVALRLADRSYNLADLPHATRKGYAQKLIMATIKNYCETPVGPEQKPFVAYAEDSLIESRFKKALLTAIKENLSHLHMIQTVDDMRNIVKRIDHHVAGEGDSIEDVLGRAAERFGTDRFSHKRTHNNDDGYVVKKAVIALLVCAIAVIGLELYFRSAGTGISSFIMPPQDAIGAWLSSGYADHRLRYLLAAGIGAIVVAVGILRNTGDEDGVTEKKSFSIAALVRTIGRGLLSVWNMPARIYDRVTGTVMQRNREKDSLAIVTRFLYDADKYLEKRNLKKMTKALVDCARFMKQEKRLNKGVYAGLEDACIDRLRKYLDLLRENMLFDKENRRKFFFLWGVSIVLLVDAIGGQYKVHPKNPSRDLFNKICENHEEREALLQELLAFYKAKGVKGLTWLQEPISFTRASLFASFATISILFGAVAWCFIFIEYIIPLMPVLETPLSRMERIEIDLMTAVKNIISDPRFESFHNTILGVTLLMLVWKGHEWRERKRKEQKEAVRQKKLAQLYANEKDGDNAHATLSEFRQQSNKWTPARYLLTGGIVVLVVYGVLEWQAVIAWVQECFAAVSSLSLSAAMGIAKGKSFKTTVDNAENPQTDLQQGGEKNGASGKTVALFKNSRTYQLLYQTLHKRNLEAILPVLREIVENIGPFCEGDADLEAKLRAVLFDVAEENTTLDELLRMTKAGGAYEQTAVIIESSILKQIDELPGEDGGMRSAALREAGIESGQQVVVLNDACWMSPSEIERILSSCGYNQKPIIRNENLAAFIGSAFRTSLFSDFERQLAITSLCREAA